jgi:hypothetical protein
MSIQIFPVELKIQADLSIVYQCAGGWIFLKRTKIDAVVPSPIF